MFSLRTKRGYNLFFTVNTYTILKQHCICKNLFRTVVILPYKSCFTQLLLLTSLQVQTEIKKTWTRWNLAFEWEGPVVCGRYRYGSVVVGLNNNSTSSQSHLAGGGPSTRSTTLTLSRAYRSSGSPIINVQATLPGYVITNSDPSIPEEAEDSGPKRVDDISLKENLPVLNTSTTAEDEEETL